MSLLPIIIIIALWSEVLLFKHIDCLILQTHVQSADARYISADYTEFRY